MGRIPVQLEVPPLRIVVVEDDELIRCGLVQFIEQLGHAVCATAADAESAVAAALWLRPDLVLMDIDLGAGPDGIAAAAAIRQGTEADIAFISGNLYGPHLDSALALKPVACLRKPYAASDLRRLIERTTLAARNLAERHPQAVC